MTEVVSQSEARRGSFGRLLPFAWVLLVLELAVGLFVVLQNIGWIPGAVPTGNDFVAFHAAGIVANGGEPALIYDRAFLHLTERQTTGAPIAYFHFLYPPVFLLLCGQLARLPYILAFGLFIGATGLLCLWTLRRIVPNVPLVVLLAFPMVFWTIGLGQNAFLTAALFALGLDCLDRRPLLAGVLLGLLCYKPHFGLLLPVALVAGGYWRTIIAAAMTVVAMIELSVGVYGAEPWFAFLEALDSAGMVYAQEVYLPGLTSPYGFALSLGVRPVVALGIQVAASLLIAGIVAVQWRRSQSPDLRAAVLLAALPLSVPAFMFYDLLLLGVALAFLGRAGVAASRPYADAMTLVYAATFFAGRFDSGLSLPITPLVALAGFALCVSAAWHAPAVNPLRSGGAALEPAP